MALGMIEGFKNLKTMHCVTGSMRHIYAFHGHDLSEDLLLGLGEGVGMAYFRFMGQVPFMGGRAQPKPSMEELAGTRTGVGVKIRRSSSDQAAEKDLVARLARGEPVMLQVDMGYLPYFDFGGQEYHFGGHDVVACGVDPDSGRVLIADRDGEPHAVSLESLRLARGSAFRPFPPKRARVEFDFASFRAPHAEDVLLAIRHQASAMLSPPIKNLGLAAIRKAAGELPKWPDLSDGWSLEEALFNFYIFESALGGSGGGIFRFMFARFLREAAKIAGRPDLRKVADDFRAVAEAWDLVGLAAKAASESSAKERGAAKKLPMEKEARLLAEPLGKIAAELLSIAELEEAAWTRAAEGAALA